MWVKRERLVEDAMTVFDDFLGLVFRRERQLVVDRFGRQGHQVECAVAVGLWQGIAVLRKASSKRHERASLVRGVGVVERVGKS